MQPYLFPYLGSFSLVDASDTYVFFDNVQYIRRGWMHRNRVHGPGGAWTYAGVPVRKAPRDTPIDQVMLVGDVDWRGRFLDVLDAGYRSVAPRFDAVMSLVRECIDPPVERLVDLNIRSFSRCCAKIGLDLVAHRATDLDLPVPTAPHGWAIAACRRLGAARYVNPPGGADLYTAAPFAAAGLRVGILRPELLPYDRCGLGWEPGLSILDALMFHPPDAVRELVRRYEIEWKVPGG